MEEGKKLPIFRGGTLAVTATAEEVRTRTRTRAVRREGPTPAEDTGFCLVRVFWFCFSS